VKNWPFDLIACAPAFRHAVGQRNVGGDDHIARLGALGDPVVGDVGAGVDHHLLDPLFSAHALIQLLDTTKVMQAVPGADA
jgi:hypothetical protein